MEGLKNKARKAFKRAWTIVSAIPTLWALNGIAPVVITYTRSELISNETTRSVLLWCAILLGICFLIWSGYLLRLFLGWLDPLYYGFRIVSRTDIHEIDDKNHNKNVHRTELSVEPRADKLMVFPVRYRWNGDGDEESFTVTGAEMFLLRFQDSDEPSYIEDASHDGKWHYRFIALNPPRHKGDKRESIQYSQAYTYKKGEADTHVGNNVLFRNTALTIKVRFPADSVPKKIRLICQRRAWYRRGKEYEYDARKHQIEGKFVFDEDTRWVTWPVPSPKRGCYYRVDWSKIS